MREYSIAKDLYKREGHEQNFTILAPGPCNAKCHFCYWDHADGKIKPPPDYLERLEKQLRRIQPKAVSISGGEPTLSPYLEDILDIVYAVAPGRVVLTTNATDLMGALEERDFHEVITHVNISRHHWLDDLNRKYFGVSGRSALPNCDDLNIRIDEHLKSEERDSVDFNINACIGDDDDISYLFGMIDLVHTFRVKSLVLRSTADSIDPLQLELDFRELFEVSAIDESDMCPVCRSLTYEVCGIDVVFKRGFDNPSEHLGKIYEYVFHQDGNLYADWKRKMPIVDIVEDATYWKEKYDELRDGGGMKTPKKKIKKPTKKKSKKKKSKPPVTFNGGSCKIIRGRC